MVSSLTYTAIALVLAVFLPHAGGAAIFDPTGPTNLKSQAVVSSSNLKLEKIPPNGTPDKSSSRVLLMILRQECYRLLQSGGYSSLPTYCHYVLNSELTNLNAVALKRFLTELQEPHKAHHNLR